MKEPYRTAGFGQGKSASSKGAWAKSAASKYAKKKQDLERNARLLDSLSPSKWDELREVFKQESETFNAESGEVLKMTAISEYEFKVTQEGSGSILTVSLVNPYTIFIEFDGEELDRAEIRVQPGASVLYLEDSDGTAVDPKRLVQSSLNALLGIK